MPRLKDVPANFQENIFKKLFNIAEVAKLPAPQRKIYEASLKTLRDNLNVERTLVEEAVIEKALTIAKKLKARGFSIQEIVEDTGLSESEIREIGF